MGNTHLELETNVGSDMIPAQNATTPGSPKPQCAKSILRNVQHRLSAAPKLKQASTPSGLSRKLNRVIGTFEVNAFPIALAPISPIKLDPKSNKFSLDILKTSFPEGVQPNQKEAYLTDEDFKKSFNMEPEEFYKMKEWRQI